MTILHTCWRDATFYVWGECEAAHDNDLAAAQGAVAESPYALHADALKEVLQTLLWSEAKELVPCSMTLTLPTWCKQQQVFVIPSQSFFAESEESAPPKLKAQLVLYPWRVMAVPLPWRPALTLFNLVQERRLGTGVFAGESLLSVATFFRYVGALVARGCFLPGVCEGRDGSFEACWHPVLDGMEFQRVRLLAERLPPIAFAGEEVPVAGGGSSRMSVLMAMLEELTDRLVRVSVVTTLSRAQAEHGQLYSAHDAWFAALRGDSRQIHWDERDELVSLCAALRQWRRPAEVGRTGEAIPGFRLEAPQSAEGKWQLQVDAVEGDVPAGLNPEKWSETFLLSLGQATLLFPPLTRAEKQCEGFGCLLALDEAHAFLTVAADMLTAAGYCVTLPAQGATGSTCVLALSLDIQPVMQEQDATHSLDQRVTTAWTVMLDGKPLTPEELEQIAQSETPLVFLRGQWVTVDLKRLREALRIWQRTTIEMHSVREAVQLALGATSGAGGLHVSQVHAGGWVGKLLAGLESGQAFETLATPEGFCGELRPYQIRGFSWLVFLRDWGFGACLADDMGLGKTVQTLAFLLHEKARGTRRPVLLAGPMSVLGNWLHEAQRFVPGLKVLLHHGARRLHGQRFAQQAAQVDIVLTSYHLLYRDYSDLRRVTWSGLILDEAQNIKNPDTRQAQAARALQAHYRIALTGTPMENHVGELWSIMDFLNVGLLGRRAVFRETYFRPIQAGTDPSARARLRRVTGPFILRRLKTDKQVISDLPEKVEAKVYCALTSEQATLYRDVLESFEREVKESEGIKRRGLILAVLTRLKQVCNHPAHYLGEAQDLAHRSGKLERLVALLEEVFARGESALVFTQYAEMGKLLKHHLCQTFAYDMPFLHGALSRQARDQMVADFQSASQPQAFILSLKAGGTGLNLTRASHVFHFDRWWNPAVENQATDRTFRIGQTRNVMVHKFICGGTLEERIDALIESKSELAAEVVASGERLLTELSDGALHEMLQLDAAVMDQDEQ